MLGRFFNFQENPFNLTPDPRFFYANSIYREAYDKLRGVVTERRGYMALTGETGAGKTTLLKTLMNDLGTSCRWAYFEYSNLTLNDFLDLACNKLGLETEAESCAEALGDFLIEQSQQGGIVAFVIDEAQNMPLESLADILTFTSGLSADDNLVQVILSGQPQLEAQLEQPQLSALQDRLYLHHRLSPLPGDEVGSFIRHRLSIAGNPGGDIITRGAIEQVTQHAQGRPRLINLLCSRALVTAYATSQSIVSAEVMEEAIQDLREEQGDQVNILLQKAPIPLSSSPGESSYNGAEDAASGHELQFVLPWNEEQARPKQRREFTLSPIVGKISGLLRWSREKLTTLIDERLLRTDWKPAARMWQQRLKSSLSSSGKVTRKILHQGREKLAALLNERPLRLPQIPALRSGVAWLKTSLPAAATPAFKALRRGGKRLSGLVSEHPIGFGTGALTAALLWVLIYPALEQKTEAMDPAAMNEMTAQMSRAASADPINRLDAPATTPEGDSAETNEPSRTFYVSNQNGPVELIETAALEVINEQADDTALASQADLGPTLLDGLPSELTGLPETGAGVAAAAAATARERRLEQKLLDSEERLARAEAELAQSREELEKAQARIQEHEARIEEYVQQIGALNNETNELRYKMVSFPEHLALRNISKPEGLASPGQATSQTEAKTEREPPAAVDPRAGIDQLLKRAGELMKARNMTTPAGNNAFEIFRKVLKIAPDNEPAQNGIEQIKKTYLAWAAKAKRKRDWLNAGNYYRKALVVDPYNPTAEAGLREVNEQASRSDEKSRTVAVTEPEKQEEEARQRLARLQISATPKALLTNAERGNIEAVRLLLAAGVSPNAKLPGGWTALMSAATHGHIDVVRTLLTEGADVNIKNNDGKTALTAAAWNGHNLVVKELLAAGAAINERNNDGWTALMYAAWNGHRQVVETLLEGEASIAVKDNNDWTALTAASSEGHLEIVKILEMAGGS